MTQSSRPNIFALLENEFSNYQTVLDIGCKGLKDLTDFETSPFKKLVGLSNKFNTTPFGDYKKCKGVIYQEGLLDVFNTRFNIHETDITNFDFGTNCNSLVICNKVLHFFNDLKKSELMDRIYISLLKEGLAYIKVNHNRNPNNTDPATTIEIEPNVFQNKNDLSDIRYLVEPNSFIQNLSNKFNVVDKYNFVDEKTVTLVFRK